jgi:hypothetical protein
MCVLLSRFWIRRPSAWPLWRNAGTDRTLTLSPPRDKRPPDRRTMLTGEKQSVQNWSLHDEFQNRPQLNSNQATGRKSGQRPRNQKGPPKFSKGTSGMERGQYRNFCSAPRASLHLTSACRRAGRVFSTENRIYQSLAITACGLLSCQCERARFYMSELSQSEGNSGTNNPYGIRR